MSGGLREKKHGDWRRPGLAIGVKKKLKTTGSWLGSMFFFEMLGTTPEVKDDR